jgi:hypothetical protein
MNNTEEQTNYTPKPQLVTCKVSDIENVAKCMPESYLPDMLHGASGWGVNRTRLVFEKPVYEALCEKYRGQKKESRPGQYFWSDLYRGDLPEVLVASMAESMILGDPDRRKSVMTMLTEEQALAFGDSCTYLDAVLKDAQERECADCEKNAMHTQAVRRLVALLNELTQTALCSCDKCQTYYQTKKELQVPQVST